MMEEGTLSIVRRAQGYQVRYASNNPHDQDRLPCVCRDEAHLAVLLHHCGAEAAAIPHLSPRCAARADGGPPRRRLG